MIIIQPQALFRSQKTLVVYTDWDFWRHICFTRRQQAVRNSIILSTNILSFCPGPNFNNLAVMNSSGEYGCTVSECCAAKTISREINPDLCVFRDTCEAEVVPHFQTERLGIWLNLELSLRANDPREIWNVYPKIRRAPQMFWINVFWCFQYQESGAIYARLYFGITF